MHFTEQAHSILDAAETAARHGQACSDTTILIGLDGNIRILADCDWPLDSLQSHHGASTAYRVSRESDKVRVEGREGLRRCLFESPNTKLAAKLILNSSSRWSM